jgi:hypothetical protein
VRGGPVWDNCIAHKPSQTLPISGQVQPLIGSPPCSLHPPQVGEAAEPTAYVRNRPRRQVGRRMQLGDTTESTDLTHLHSFVGPPGTGAPAAQVGVPSFWLRVGRTPACLPACLHCCLGTFELPGLLLLLSCIPKAGPPPGLHAYRTLLTVPARLLCCARCVCLQPFSVTIDQQALLVMDFHAHLSRCEIIGLLGGSFDAQRRVVDIREAYPCRRAEGQASGTQRRHTAHALAPAAVRRGVPTLARAIAREPPNLALPRVLSRHVCGAVCGEPGGGQLPDGAEGAGACWLVPLAPSV